MGISIDEKRVYDASEGPTPVYVVGEFGVARVNTSDDLVGEFGLARQCSARDAAGRGGRVAVATDEDVLVATAGDDGEGSGTDGEGAGTDDEAGGADEETFEALGVGSAVAVGYADDELVVAHEDGRVRRGDGEEWTHLGDLGEVRAVEGDFVAAASGVHRAVGDDLRHVGLDDASDVAAGDAPLVATVDGVYRLGNGWLDELPGDFRAVSAPATSDGEGREPAASDDGVGTASSAHAARADGRLFTRGERRTDSAREGRRADGDWREVDRPVASEVVALDHGEAGCAYAVTDDGTLLLSVGDGWNYQRLGLRGVRAVAAP